MDNISFSGKIKFVNPESYKNFVGYRNEINNLKHNCGNKKFTHLIQHDKDFFVITTNYKHALKRDFVGENSTSYILPSPTPELIKNLVKEHIKHIKNWKSEIDKTPSFNINHFETVKKESFWNKILKIFKKK